MHLLAAMPGLTDDGSGAVDLGQSPADLVVISAADSELALWAEAHAETGGPSLRLASLAHLQHPMSVDQHLQTCATGSRLVVARVLGGLGYWRYGLEQYAIRLRQAGVAFAALPGDDKPDEELWHLSSVAREDWENLLSYCVEGGPPNAASFLLYAGAMLGQGDRPGAARPLLKAGLHWPGATTPDLSTIRTNWTPGAPIVPLVFYRALLQGAGMAPVNRMIKALLRRGLNPLPVFVASLKDALSVALLERLFAEAPPDVILNFTAFATGSAHADVTGAANPLDVNGAVVLQVVLAATTRQQWQDGLNGLSARDIAMNVALPEVDGRVLSRAVAFKGQAWFDEATQCPITTWDADGERIDFVAELAANWARLRSKSVDQRRVALVLANYPNRDGRLANGVGLDTPTATVQVLNLLRDAGYGVTGQPDSGAGLMAAILAGPTNWLTDRVSRLGGVRHALEDYRAAYDRLPWSLRSRIEDRWGGPEADPFFADGHFTLSVLEFGNVVVGIQPARGYNIDPKDSYHSPDLVPPHHYLAFYFWLRGTFGADAVVHLGKHGNLEWLPGKALALSAECLPEAVLGPMPHVYPFIVNDPGEGTQAKRRTQAVIVDHLTPPMTRAETYGPLKDLEALVDEYYEAAGLDRRRLDHLRREILALTASGIAEDAGLTGQDEVGDLARLDAWLCELKEAQIRDGLHVFGVSPQGVQERDLALALVRVPRGDGKGGNASLLRAMAEDMGLAFDPLDCDMAAPWQGPRPRGLAAASAEPWRSTGDTVERLEWLASRLVEGLAMHPQHKRVAAVVEELHGAVLPAIRACGPDEGKALLTALAGRFVAPGPSGAPTRGRLDVLPTGRNFHSVDSRALPTQAAWALGWKSAMLLVERHLQDHGDWPRALLLTAWGTANMRTGGDDIAQALALMGVRPVWEAASRRVTGFEIMPLGVLDRPRVDVTLRVSGFFRDAFPQQIDLIDSAARAVMALDEPADMNPAAARFRAEGDASRVFGSKPGAYGAGLQALIDERLWGDRADLAEAYLEWGSYAYGGGKDGIRARKSLETRLGQVEAVVQNQDNREHDLLDSDDYYQFEGGAAAAVSTLQGRDRPVYHNDHSRPERPVIRTLEDEIARVVRSRVVNPKWIEGTMRHGYKGAFEMAATLDYLFAFAATTGSVRNHHFDLVHAAFLEDERVRDFIEANNAPALCEMAERLEEAIDRGLWVPRSNSARDLLARLRRT